MRIYTYIHIYICVCVYMRMCTLMCLSLSLSLCVCARACVCASVRACSLYLSRSLSLSLSLSLPLFVCLPAVFLPACLPACLPGCLCVHARARASLKPQIGIHTALKLGLQSFGQQHGLLPNESARIPQSCLQAHPRQSCTQGRADRVGPFVAFAPKLSPSACALNLGLAKDVPIIPRDEVLFGTGSA